MLFREIVYHPKSHFSRIRSRKQLDGSGIEGRTKCFLRIKPDAVHLFFLHVFTPGNSISGFYKKIRESIGSPAKLIIPVCFRRFF